MISWPLEQRVEFNLEQAAKGAMLMQEAKPQKHTSPTAQQPESSTSTTSAAVGGPQDMQRVIHQLIAPALTHQRIALDVVRM